MMSTLSSTPSTPFRWLCCRQASTRISAREALEHPWFRAQLGYIPQPTSDMTISSLGSVDSLLMMEQHELMAPV
jgi:hypothetical protein